MPMRPSLLRFSRPLPVLLLALLGACATGPAARSTPAPTPLASVVPAPEPKPYVRARRPAADTFTLAVCIRKFEPVGAGPVVYLAGAIHIGEPAYYAAVQKHLDAQTIVLFEGVSTRDPQAAAARAKHKAEGSDGYSRLAKALGLVSQMAGIDYHRAHFQNADMTMEDLQATLAAKAAAPGQAGADAREALAQFDFVRSFLSGDNPIMALGLWALENQPAIRTQVRMTMVQSLAQEKMPAALSESLMETILMDRNEAALKKLAKTLEERPDAKSISLFYGAAHLPGMEKQLVKKFHYRPAGSQWLTSMTVHPQAEGMSKDEVEEAYGAWKEPAKKTAAAKASPSQAR